MLNVKVKTVCKILAYVSVFLIICFIEGKYNLIFKDAEKAEIVKPKIFQSDYIVYGKVQGKLWKMPTVLTFKNLAIHKFLCCFRCFLPKGKICCLVIKLNETSGDLTFQHAVEEATRLGVRGWCMNTKDFKVKGVIEGEEKAFNDMCVYLGQQV